MRLSASLKPLALAALLAAAGGAHAALTVYTSQASFLAALAAPGVDTFDSLGVNVDLADPLSRSAGAYGYTAASSGGGAGLGTVGAGTDAWLTTLDSNSGLHFSVFSTGLRAFGGYFFATGDPGTAAVERSVTVSASDAGGSVTHELVNATSASFVGFVSTGPLSMVEVLPVPPGAGEVPTPFWATANDITMGTVSAVPEPGTWALMMSGVGLLSVTWRRRRSGQAR